MFGLGRGGNENPIQEVRPCSSCQQGLFLLAGTRAALRIGWTTAASSPAVPSRLAAGGGVGGVTEGSQLKTGELVLARNESFTSPPSETDRTDTAAPPGQRGGGWSALASCGEQQRLRVGGGW